MNLPVIIMYTAFLLSFTFDGKIRSGTTRYLREEFPVTLELWLVVEVVPVGSHCGDLHALQLRAPGCSPSGALRSVTSGAGGMRFLL